MYERERQTVGVVLSMAGTQETGVASHHPGTPNAVVGIRIGGTLMYVHDRETAVRFARLWVRHGLDAAKLPARLPPSAVPAEQISHVTGGVDTTVVMDARGRPPASARLYRPRGRPRHLRVQLGRVVFDIRDQAAFVSVRGAFLEASALAAAVLPEQLVTRSRREQAFGRAAAALPPVDGGHQPVSRRRTAPPVARTTERQPSAFAQEATR